MFEYCQLLNYRHQIYRITWISSRLSRRKSGNSNAVANSSDSAFRATTGLKGWDRFSHVVYPSSAFSRLRIKSAVTRWPAAVRWPSWGWKRRTLFLRWFDSNKVGLRKINIDMAAKKRKKHKNKISGLVISMCRIAIAAIFFTDKIGNLIINFG